MAKNILFVHYGDDWIRGSERCLLDLIKYLDSRAYRPFVWTNNRELTKQLGLMNVPSELNHFPLIAGWKAPRFDVASWLNLIEYGCKLIERENIDLIHVNSAAPCQWMVAAARIKHIPLVTQLHCGYTVRDRLTLGVHASPHVISVSRHVAMPLLRDGYPVENLSVVHNGIDVNLLEAQEKVDVRQTLSISEHDFIFATVGSMIHRKGIDRIMTALRHVTLEHPNACLVVIGDGPLRDKLESQADALHLGDRIHFVREQHNVVGWLKGCDTFISGARSEAFGLVLAEAAIAQIPIIAPYEGGIPEFIHHKDTGILYPNRGIGGMTKAMRIVVNNPNLCRELATRAYQYIHTHHDLEITCRKIEKVYVQLLSHEPKTQLGFFRTFLPLKTFVSNRITMGGQHG